MSGSIDDIEERELIDESDETDYCRSLFVIANIFCTMREETAITASRVADTVDIFVGLSNDEKKTN